MSDVADDGLTASVDVNVLYRDDLLAPAPFPCQSFDLQGVGAHEFGGQVAEDVEPFQPVTMIEVPCDGPSSAGNQLQQGKKYDRLTNVVAITITDFIMFGELADQVTRFMLRAAANPEITLDDLELVFAELPKFHKQEEQLESIEDKWFYFLKYAGDLKMVPKILAEEPAIKKAFELANKAALTPEELDDQERREIFIQDQRGAIQFAERKSSSEVSLNQLK